MIEEKLKIKLVRGWQRQTSVKNCLDSIRRNQWFHQ